MITIKEIAKKANVSIGTVDRVLHKRGRYSTTTATLINNIIQEYDYKPNIYASNLSSPKTHEISILMPHLNQDGGYWNLPYQGILKAKEHLPIENINLTFYHFDKQNRDSFTNAASKLRNRSFDALLMAPVISDLSNQLIEQLPKNTPYTFFDADIPSKKRVSYIGQDSYQSGYLAGRLTVLSCYNQGEILIIKNIENDAHIESRIRGFEDYLKKIPNISSSSINIITNNHQNEIDKRLTKLFNKNNNINGIFVTNSKVSPFAEYLERKGLANICLIGYDLLQENIPFLKNGTIDFLINQQPTLQGYKGLTTLYDFLIRKIKPETDILLPIDIITKENYLYYKNYLRSIYE